MIMTPRLRKFALTVHVTSSVGVFGAIAGFLLLAIVGVASEDAPTARAAYIAMSPIAWFVIVTLVFAALLTGLIQSLGTSWGLFRHWWVLVKFLATLIVTIVLLLQLELISFLAEAARSSAWSPDAYRDLRFSPVLHASGGLLVLLFPLALSIYKPRGMTRHGWRKRHEQGI